MPLEDEVAVSSLGRLHDDEQLVILTKKILVRSRCASGLGLAGLEDKSGSRVTTT